MADIALVTANRVRVAEPDEIITETHPAAEAITAGAPVRRDTTTGNFTNGNASGAAEARVVAIALHTVAAGEPLTGLRFGAIDGLDVSALAHDAAVYLSNTDGRLADAAGTTSLVVGRVRAAHAVTLGTSADKVVQINLLAQ